MPDGEKKQVKAVSLMRHVVSLRAQDVRTAEERNIVAEVRSHVQPTLTKAGVLVPSDLSFCNDSKPEQTSYHLLRGNFDRIRALWMSISERMQRHSFGRI